MGERNSRETLQSSSVDSFATDLQARYDQFGHTILLPEQVALLTSEFINGLNLDPRIRKTAGQKVGQLVAAIRGRNPEEILRVSRRLQLVLDNNLG